jgi:hypothetical protein
VKQIRKRITYANVMSSIAVFLVLGGGAAYAAKKIGSNEIKGNSITTGKIKKEAVTASKIKKNSVTTAKIANGAVTGAKLNLGSVGTVPNANHANTADNANNANTVGGQSVQKILFRTTSDTGTVGPQNIYNAGGLTIAATCTNGQATVTATTSKNDSSLYVEVFDDLSTEVDHEIWESGEFDPGVNADMLAGNGGNNDMSLFEYDAVDGSVVTGQINTDEDGALNGCRVTGHATAG